MPIQSGDIKLLKSAVMADVPEGGGPPTGIVIPDGVSNSIFSDVSELDRAGGRFNMIKVHVAIETDDRDTYYGANIIVAEPFQDPRVSACMFAGTTFDTRAQAQSRVESYLNKGAEWNGFLYENHIAGQRAIQLFQRVDSELPRVGQTLVLVQNEGLSTQKEQYVRITKVSKVERTFTYNVDTDYKAWVVTLDISDALRNDYTGTSANRQFQRGVNATLTRDTLVADAGSYYSAKPLAQPASIGDFSVEATSIYTQLVPSAQTETPLADVSLTQTTLGYNPSGDTIVQTLNIAFTTTQSMFVGGGILPGSLTIARDGVTLTDKGGLLYNGATQVGLVDYENGIPSLVSNVFGTGGGAHVVTYTPAAAARMIGGSIGEYVTAENRSLTKVYTLPDVPAPYSLSVSYQVNGRWYVLREDGAGAIRGSDSSYGAGTLNRTTGTTAVTFGFLPDVGSAIIYQWLPGIAAGKYPLANLSAGNKAFHEIVLPHRHPIHASITIAWNDGTARTATVNAAGIVSGAATGAVRNSVIYLSPTAVPAKGTAFTVGYDYQETIEAGEDIGGGNYTVTDQGARWRLTFADLVGTLRMGNLLVNLIAPTHFINGVQSGSVMYSVHLSFINGEVFLGWWSYATATEAIGTVGADYIEFDKTVVRGASVWVVESHPMDVGGVEGGVATASGRYDTINATMQTAPGSTLRVLSGRIYAGTTTSGNHSLTHNSASLRIRTNAGFGELSAVRFKMGGETYADNILDDVLYRAVSATTGTGTATGSILPAQGLIDVTDWAAGISPVITDWSAVLAPPVAGVNSPYTTPFVVFRTATAPLRPQSMTISGETHDGVAFTVTADGSGKFNHSRLKGRINVESGVVEVYATYPGDPAAVTPPGGYSWASGRGPAVDLSFLGIPGVSLVYSSLLKTATLKYNAVGYTYLPLDADILGIDPVRLPSDGKVPVFRPGGFAVVGHTGEVEATVSNGQTINCGRVRLSRVRVVGDNGAVIHTGYTADLEAGTVTFTNVSGYSQPVTIQHRIEDMAIVSDAQISGLITFTRPLTHDYPLGSYVSSALVEGDVFSRVNTLFDQHTWDLSWKDTVVGTPATATFNSTQYPILVTNRGALTERWAVRFTGATAFEVIGENVGVIAVGNTSADCAPNNPAKGVPYFTIPALGWGSGWAPGNVLRFNTIASGFSPWIVRTVQQGPETVTDDTFTLLIRGDINTP